MGALAIFMVGCVVTGLCIAFLGVTSREMRRSMDFGEGRRTLASEAGRSLRDGPRPG